MDKTQFLRTYLPYARSVSEQTGIAPEVVLAQTALETGWGKSAPSGNFFGIKGSGQTLPTQEFRNGQMVTENAGFRSYASPADSFTDYAKLMMNNKRYAPVLGAQGADAQIEALGKSGYATDPNYAAKLSQIKNSINLNSPDLIGSDTMRALGISPGAIGPMTGSNQPQRTGAPMGLLDTQPAQQPEQKKSGFWDNFAGGLLADPDRRAKIGIALEGMTLNPNRGLIQNLQSGIDTRKEQAVANRTIEWLAKQPGGQKFAELAASAGPAAALKAYQDSVSGASGPAGFQALKAQALAAGLVEGTPEFQQFMLYGGAKQDATPSAFQALHLQAIAAGYAEGSPEYQRFMQTRGAGEVASARALGTAQGAASSELAGGEIAMNQALNLVEALKNDPALPSMVGPIDSYKPNVSAAANRFQSRLDQLKGTAFLQAYQMLKGGGAITENEGKKAEQAMSRLNTAMNEEDFIAALNEFQDAVRTGYEKIKARSGMGAQPMAPSVGGQPAQGNDDPLGLRGAP